MATATLAETTREVAARKRALTRLAKHINEEHAACEGSVRHALDHARNAGGLLREAKSKCSTGARPRWLAANFRGSEQTAKTYMQICDGWSEIRTRAPSLHVSVQEARKLLKWSTWSETAEREPTPVETAWRCLELYETAASKMAEIRDQIDAHDAADEPTPFMVQEAREFSDYTRFMHGGFSELRQRAENAVAELTATLSAPELKLFLAELTDCEKSLVLHVVNRKDAS